MRINPIHENSRSAFQSGFFVPGQIGQYNPDIPVLTRVGVPVVESAFGPQPGREAPVVEGYYEYPDVGGGVDIGLNEDGLSFVEREDNSKYYLFGGLALVAAVAAIWFSGK